MIQKHVSKITINKKYFSLAVILFVVGFLYIPHFVQASTEVSLIPSMQNIEQGTNFTVDLKVSASGTSVNVVDGTVIFDTNKLEIKNVNTGGSILSVWPKQPIFDNSKGEISFIGGVTNGFIGQNGQVLRITFLAKKSGQTKIDFRDSFAVYQNDGKGTKINPWLKPIELSINQKTTKQFEFPWFIVSLVLVILVIIFLVRKYVKFK